MIVEKTVQQVLREKRNREIFTIGPDEMVSDALKIMARQNAGAVVVMEREVLVGMVSEQEYARKVELAGRSAHSTPVRDIMSVKTLYVHPDDSADGVLALMTEKRVRHVPVLERGTLALVGLVSIGDIVKSVVSDRSHLGAPQARYVSGDDFEGADSDEKRQSQTDEGLSDDSEDPRLRGIN